MLTPCTLYYLFVGRFKHMVFGLRDVRVIKIEKLKRKHGIELVMPSDAIFGESSLLKYIYGCCHRAFRDFHVYSQVTKNRNYFSDERKNFRE
ncbi:predicted protein [Sclerotinia sclerotiorum 1980 UF-70]|uniref:Uncharacterized protein n=1 Tax=Sclerotinia sclerotiorum (strain ATCC 18683 / 1980 / Ss-1) TaxID=665079 RepID=A7ESU9_SCLS1|nr:predicted protein [Sclerotinia sclerotiorum 1980 UF-70]EDN92541.1 predicted protein [Sclerotinia sclerotiorum 1980 UF-70]